MIKKTIFFFICLFFFSLNTFAQDDLNPEKSI